MANEDFGIDVDSAVSEIAAGLNLSTDNTDTNTDTNIDTGAETTNVETPPAENAEATSEAPQVRAAPKSWSKEMQEDWGAIPPKLQEYWETREKQMLDGLDQYRTDATFGKQLRDVITPYIPLIQAQGIDEPKAVQFLLNAHYRLSHGQPQERQAYFAQLAKSYGIDLGNIKPNDAPVDPKVKELEDNLNQIRSHLSTQEQRALTERVTRVSQDVNAFASDPTHPYFDEVADDIAMLIRAGNDLDKAYEKAIWANPVTRQKEIARLQQESEAKLRDKAKTEAEKAQKASSTNVRSRETRKAPTEPKGTMEDTMRETLREIRNRAH